MFIKLESIYDSTFGINPNSVCKISRGNQKTTSSGSYYGPFCILTMVTGENEYVKGSLDEVISKLEGIIES